MKLLLIENTFNKSNNLITNHRWYLKEHLKSNQTIQDDQQKEGKAAKITAKTEKADDEFPETLWPSVLIRK